LTQHSGRRLPGTAATTAIGARGGSDADAEGGARCWASFASLGTAVPARCWASPRCRVIFVGLILAGARTVPDDRRAHVLDALRRRAIAASAAWLHTPLNRGEAPGRDYVDHAAVPPNVRELVRQYFADLEGQ